MLKNSTTDDLKKLSIKELKKKYHISQKKVLSHQMGVFQWIQFKKSGHHTITWEDFNRHRKK